MLEVWRKGNLSRVVGNVNWYSHYEEQYGDSLSKTRATIWSCNPTPDIYLEKNMVWKDTCTPTFTAVLFTIAKTQKTWMSINRWMDKQDVLPIPPPGKPQQIQCNRKKEMKGKSNWKRQDLSVKPIWQISWGSWFKQTLKDMPFMSFHLGRERWSNSPTTTPVDRNKPQHSSTLPPRSKRVSPSPTLQLFPVQLWLPAEVLHLAVLTPCVSHPITIIINITWPPWAIIYINIKNGNVNTYWVCNDIR